MDLNKLRTFIVVAEVGNITKAAELLFRTQPAISSQLKSLERETRLVLFERKSSRIFLTKEGHTLYEYAKQRICEMDDMVERLRNDSENLTGVIRLGILEEFCEYLIPDLIQNFNLRYPKVLFDIQYFSHIRLESALLSSDIDFALMGVYKDKHFFDTKPFLYTPKLLVCTPELRPQYQHETDLLHYPMLALGEQNHSLRLWFEKNKHKSAIKLINKSKPSIVVNHARTMIELCLKGLGVCFAYDLMVNEYIKQGKLVEVFPNSSKVGLTLDVCRRKVRTPNLLHDLFWTFMLEQAKQKLP